MKKKHRRNSKLPAVILKTVLWLITAALLGAGILSGGSGEYAMPLLGASAAMALISVAVTLWLDTRACRQEFRDED